MNVCSSRATIACAGAMTNMRSTYHFSYSPDSSIAFSNGSVRRLTRRAVLERNKRLLPDAQAFVLLLEEDHLPLIVAEPREVAVVGPIEEGVALGRATSEEIALVEAVEMHLEGLPRRRHSPARSLFAMSGSPAAAISDGSQSSEAKMPLISVRGFVTPGQRTIAGTR